MNCAPVIVSTNYKGGVGKTVTSRVLAQAIAHMPDFNKGKPVLIVDLDPQGNTSRRWQLLNFLQDGTRVPKPHPGLTDEKIEYSSACDVWMELLGGTSVAPLPYDTTDPMIKVVPAHEAQMGRIVRVTDEQIPILGHRLREWLRGADIAEEYCAVIIDTQPSKTPMIDAALMAATHVYIPFVPEPQPIEGVYSIVSYVWAQSQNRGDDVPLQILGLLANMVQNTRLHALHLKKLKDNPTFGKYLMPVRLRRRISYSETDDYENTPSEVTALAGSAVEIEAKKFAKYIISKIGAGNALKGAA